jgi:hypothetical protein
LVNARSKKRFVIYFVSLFLWKTRSEFMLRNQSDSLGKPNLMGTAEQWRLSWLLMLGEMFEKVDHIF